MTVKIHPTADIASDAHIGDGSLVWHQVQVREGVQVGEQCILGKGVYLDAGVQIGNRVKIQNYVSIFQGVTIEDGVFVGPHACFTNDLRPRAVSPEGVLKSGEDWHLARTLVRSGASIGANATILCGITIGRWAMVGAGSVVTHDVPDYGMVTGNPARLRGFVCPCGEDLVQVELSQKLLTLRCSACSRTVQIDNKPHVEIE